MRVSTIATLTLLALFATNPVAGAEASPAGSGSATDDPFGKTEPSDAAELPSVFRKRVWVDADSAATERVLSVLDSNLSSAGLDFTETPLEEIIAFLADEYAIPIHFDSRGLDEIGIGSDEPITVSMRDVKLRVALRAVLEQLELTYLAADGYLLITSEEKALARLQIALYDVSDLVRDGGHATYDALIRTITSTIGRGAWAGSGTADILPFPERGVLVISQTSEAHEKISGLLSALSERPPQALTTKSPSFGGMGMAGGRFGGEGLGRGGGRRGGAARE